MDRLEALSVFVAVAERGSFVGAARHLARSPASVTRAIAGLEDRLRTRLFNRTTRAVALTDAGARYLDLCKRALAEFEELELSAAGERAEPQGLITMTAPELFGRLHILPIILAFMGRYPAVRVSLLLLNRIVSFVDEGIDLGLRIAHLPDSSMHAILVGHVRRIVCASPDYLARRGTPKKPAELAGHDVISTSGTRPANERWTFGSGKSAIHVAIEPRLAVSTAQAGLDAAASGGGILRLLSYQSEALEKSGGLLRILSGFEPPPIPIHIVHPAGRYLAPKLRLFIDDCVETLRGKFGGAGPQPI
jgi:DNA-binding transcriptional LysR family regulator